MDTMDTSDTMDTMDTIDTGDTIVIERCINEMINCNLQRQHGNHLKFRFPRSLPCGEG